MTFRKIACVAAGLSTVTACTESGTLRLDSQIDQKTAALTQTGSALEIADGTLVIDRARLSASEIEIEGGKDEEREAEFGPAVVDLALDGTPTTIAVNTVEAGSYHTVGFELRPRELDGEPASILVEGSYDGEPFEFRSVWSPELEFSLDPEVVVPANGEATVGVIIDVKSWFVNEDGSALDPTDPADQDRIEDGLADSLIAQAIEVELGEDDD